MFLNKNNKDVCVTFHSSADTTHLLKLMATFLNTTDVIPLQQQQMFN